MISPALLDFFSRYLAFDTSLESGENYAKAINLLDEEMRRFGFDTERVNIPEEVAHRPNRVNLIARAKTIVGKPTVLIYNHIDVVPASYPEAYTLRQEDGKLYGRGASDMKGCTLALLSAFEQLVGKDLQYNLVVIFTTDEETEQIEQLRYLQTKLSLPNDTIVIDPDTFAGGISVAHLGLLQLQIQVKGKSVHSGMSHLGRNAIVDAAKLTLFIQEIRETYENTFSAFTAPKGSGLTNPCNRINVNMISGGSAANVIPDTCTLTVDCRYIPEADVAKEKQKLIELVEAFCKKESIDVSIHANEIIEGYATDHQITSRLSSVYEEVSGTTDVFCVLGSTPLSQWCKENKFPHIGLGVIRADNNIHGINEFCYEKDINEVATTYSLFFQKGP